MKKDLKEQVVVITGSSSGIGRSAALDFARNGAFVVLAARNEASLNEVAKECEQLGGKALVVPTDVTDEKAVLDLAQAAVKTFGRIDIWINNAAVSMFSRFWEAPYEPFRRVIETNLMGYVHGVRAVIPHFLKQGSGILINNASVIAKSASPFVSAYAISKYGIIGLSDSLRQELFDYPNIHVCTLLPASIDTPLFQHAANYTGKAIKPLDPVIDASRVSQAMLELALNPQRELTVGISGLAILAQRALAPGLAEKMMAKQVTKDHFQDEPAAPTDGNLFQPAKDWTGVSGGWKQS